MKSAPFGATTTTRTIDMNEMKRLQDRLDAHGASLANWPDRDRQWAEGLLARSDPARRLVREAESFDAMLASAGPGAPGDALRNRVMAALADETIRRRTPQRTAWTWWQWSSGLGAAAASMALSFYAGTFSSELVLPSDLLNGEGTIATESDTGSIDGLLFEFVLYGDDA